MMILKTIQMNTNNISMSGIYSNEFNGCDITLHCRDISWVIKLE